MNTNSNSYTIVYASVLVVIVAFLLAFVNSSLRDLQGKNVELDTKKQILSALNIREVQDAEAEFAKVVKADMVVAEDGTLKPYEGTFVTGYEKEYKENGRSFTFIMFDLNNYKYINDELGHLAGDEILKIIARNMRECIGDYDILGRCGGDEFYLFTETTDKDKLHDLEKRLVKAVEETEYDDSLNVKNGFCAGVVIVKDGNFNSFEDIVRLADSRLYGAKGKIKRENGLAVESMVMGIDDDN